MVDIRQAASHIFGCTCSEDTLFSDWDEMKSKEDKKIILDRGGIPCEGGGFPGSWCHGCPWGYMQLAEEYDIVDDEKDWWKKIG